MICSAYSETLEFDKGWVDRADMLVSRDPKLMLFRVEQFGGDALGVLRDIGDKKALVTILGINSSLFDIMPAELRAHGEVLLALRDGAQLGEFMLEADEAPVHPVDFEKSSARYPLRAVIRIDKTVLSGRQWRSRSCSAPCSVSSCRGPDASRAPSPISIVRSRAASSSPISSRSSIFGPARSGAARSWRAGCAGTARWSRR